jgi:hypothetical protein
MVRLRAPERKVAAAFVPRGGLFVSDGLSRGNCVRNPGLLPGRVGMRPDAPYSAAYVSSGAPAAGGCPRA